MSALAHKLGQLKFRESRDRARMQLGTRFDIRSFHDEMLNGGVLPLDLLDSRTDSWVRVLCGSTDLMGRATRCLPASPPNSSKN
jgi:hypothetical protein